ncbi:MAG: hypothetical protein ACLPZM_03675 [Thermoplasmata archaeon]
MSQPLAPPPSFARRLGWLAGAAGATGILVISILVGTGVAAPATIGPGPAETGQGADIGQASLAYWVWQATQLWAIPTPVPTTLSTTATTPTVLSATASSYTINAATAKDQSVRWEFEETTTAPASTELELRFLDGLTRTAVAVRIYLETRATAPAAALDFLLYWDAGAFAPGAVTIATMQVDVLACTSVGHCP